MALNTDDKKKIIEEFATKTGDTGSHEVQIALLSLKIDKLVDHLKKNPKDNHSRRGLIKLVSERRKHEKYAATQKPKDGSAVKKTVKKTVKKKAA